MDNHKRKRWDEFSRVSEEFLKGLEDFLNDAFKDRSNDCKIQCPCRKCSLRYYKNRANVYDDIVINGIITLYEHGNYDAQSCPTTIPKQKVVDSHGDDMVGLLEDAFGVGGHNFSSMLNAGETEETQYSQPRDEYDMFCKLMADAEIPLYPACKFSKLSFVLHLYRLKCQYNWSNESMNSLLKLLQDALPEGHCLPESSGGMKKMVDNLGLKYEKIHACPNDCLLFRKEYVNDDFCVKCGSARWKSDVASAVVPPKKRASKIPTKVVRYFPLIPRLQRLFMSRKTSELMKWHDNGRTKDGVLRHPADSETWQNFDRRYPDFAKDPRNVRLGLASDGFNPFGSMQSTYSTWPVILTPYNLPPWLCMKQSYLWLTVLIPGPTGPGNAIDVYLEPVIEELNQLWEVGVETFDALSEASFMLRAALMWTVQDFPALAYLSGWTTASGSCYACPTCKMDTHSKRLKFGRKLCFMGHRRFLPKNHKFRYNSTAFDGCSEFRDAPNILSGTEELQQLQDIHFSYGRLNGNVCGVPKNTWKKKSILFRLSYWEFHLLRHNLDVMHIEKNVCDNLLYTILNLDKKSKDNLKARRDLEDMQIRPDLWPKDIGNGRIYLAPACFTLSVNDKKKLYQHLSKLKFVDGHASNISRAFRKQNKLSGLKSHDCHVMMQHILPIALRGALPDKVSMVIIDLCNYFRVICGKNLRKWELELFESKIAVTLSQLEQIFPPAFFTIMVHLVVHLASEAKIAGPVFYRWMYPFERFLSTLKSKVRNRARPEGSIAEAYIAEECLNFCSLYFDSKDNNDSNKVTEIRLFNDMGKHFGRSDVFRMDDKTWTQAHRYVLFNCDVLVHFKEEHITYLKRQHRRHRPTQRQIDRMHSETFHSWLKNHVSMLDANGDEQVTDEIRDLARGPNIFARKFHGFDCCSGYRFRTMSYEENLCTRNSGVLVTAKTQSYSSTNDVRPLLGDVNYYGKLTDIIEIVYGFDKFKVVLFKCDWADVTQGRGIKIDKLGFTLVSFENLIHSGDRISDEPYIFASQAEQVMYVEDPMDSQWFVPVQIKPRDTFDMGEPSVHQGVHAEASTTNDAEDDAVI